MNQRFVVERFGPDVSDRIYWGCNKGLLGDFCRNQNAQYRRLEYHVREAYPGEDLSQVPLAKAVFKLMKLQ